MKLEYLLILALTESALVQTCLPGYKLIKRNGCVDEDECVYEDQICGDNAECFNTNGGYYCQCHEGFKPPGNFTANNSITCQDIDECLENSINCGFNAECINADGSYTCVCNMGYTPSTGAQTFIVRQGVECIDRNECLDSDLCGKHASCHNTPGDYYCTCAPGFRLKSGGTNFTGDTSESCESVCDIDASICGGGSCKIGKDGHECVCKSGFTNYGHKETKCTVSGLNITPLTNCLGTSCIQNVLNHIDNKPALPSEDVINLLHLVLNTLKNISSSSLVDPKNLVSQVNLVLNVIEKLVSELVKTTNTSNCIYFTLDFVEAMIYMVGPQMTSNKILHLNTTNAFMDIDLIGIAKNNLDTKSAAMAFMSYNTMENLLKAEFFNPSTAAKKTMMSTVISATLLNTSNTQLTKPVNFTFKHIREFVLGNSLFCVYWKNTEWIEDGCSVLETNSSYTVCSCVHLSTFALIMQTSSSPPEDDQWMNLLNVVAVIVGLVFTSLALLTFAFGRWKPGVNNVTRINLCISLLSAHLLFLLTQQFLKHIKTHQVLCGMLSGFLHFLFLSCFVWMFIEAVLLYICVRNLLQISFGQRAVLSSRFLIVIGYGIVLVIVCISVGLFPGGYGSDKCWLKEEKGFIWSFLGPVFFILALNTILFISMIITLNSTLTKLNAEVSRIKHTRILVFKTMAQFVVLGCPWILSFFTKHSKMMEILFVILNSQQGTFIFLIHCVLNNEIRRQYVKWMRALFQNHPM
ncbi:LOW QUALITY PROTEIN: adhesion G protein-coupled receptor E1 [Triplophysa dalaica]|uniref:LOW QUALITY PROTEIN: adhesion G protein-coupled receptor E1 n=1 Tax=Triplophysa dalaica TaxID=1582913 RepID=UPI0024DF583F|nr:LOW QUALITY PROTEIN: adhesion G protein-coupled receptor E1 [Triplophysa dalaica]